MKSTGILSGDVEAVNVPLVDVSTTCLVRSSNPAVHAPLGCSCVQLPLTAKGFLHFDAIECIIMTLGCPPEGVLDASLIKIALTHEDNLDR